MGTRSNPAPAILRHRVENRPPILNSFGRSRRPTPCSTRSAFRTPRSPRDSPGHGRVLLPEAVGPGNVEADRRHRRNRELPLGMLAGRTGTRTRSIGVTVRRRRIVEHVIGEPNQRPDCSPSTTQANPPLFRASRTRARNSLSNASSWQAAPNAAEPAARSASGLQESHRGMSGDSRKRGGHRSGHDLKRNGTTTKVRSTQ